MKKTSYGNSNHKMKQKSQGKNIVIKTNRKDSEDICSNDIMNISDDNLVTDSAFVLSVMKKKLKSKTINTTHENHTKKKSNDINGKSILHKCFTLSDELLGFTIVDRSKNANKFICDSSPEKCCKKGYELILQNEKSIASHYFSKAIEFDVSDIRHYINRSYCYLCTGEYPRALSDIQYVLNKLTDPYSLSKMKCREAQVLRGMENYDLSEKCFNESLNFLPNCVSVQCEKLRMKLTFLMDIGYSEKEVLNLLLDNPNISIKDAVTFLCEFEREPDNYSIDEIIDDAIFQSDSEDSPSNTKIFMEIIGFDDKSYDDLWYKQSSKQKTSFVDNRRVETIQKRMRVINTAATVKMETNKISSRHGKATKVNNQKA